MGTRSLTFVYNEDREKIINMYRQMDGFPSEHGADLAEFLTEITLVNGISLADTRKIANGMECLAAQLVAQFKHDAGGIYLHPTTTTNWGQDYEYHIYCDHIDVKEVPYKGRKKTLFRGDWEGFKIFCRLED